MVEMIKDFEIEMDRGEVCRFLGYQKDKGPNSTISSLIDEGMDQAYALIEPMCFYHLADIRRIRYHRIFMEDSLIITSEVLSQVLSRCEQVAIFVANIGRCLEESVSQLMNEGHMLKAAILDAIGSEAAEKTACYFQDEIREFANSTGAETTLRYSPGYCDWDITQQRVIFEAMDSAPMGVTLTEECLMVPRKSVSGVIGLGQFERSVAFSPCLLCDKWDCSSRR